jgi:hypothetical protein
MQRQDGASCSSRPRVCEDRDRAHTCLASINTALDRQGIARRVTPLELVPSDLKQWEAVQKGIAALPNGESLIAHTLKNFAAYGATSRPSVRRSPSASTTMFATL